jgi:hypothetical protein
MRLCLELVLCAVAKQMADEITESAKEKKSLREFCLTSLEQKRLVEESKEKKKEDAAVAKAARAELDAWIRSQNTSKCFSIPKQRYKELEQQLSAQGIPPLPCYVRLKRQTSDSSISPATVEECIQEVSWENVEASEGSTAIERIAKAIVDTLRKNIRSTRESVQLSDSLEKGAKHLEVPDLDEDAIQTVLKFHVSNHHAKEVAQASKGSEQQSKTELKQLEAVVDKVLTKTNRTAQPITLEGVEGMHKIVKKTSARSEKLTLGTFQEFVEEALGQLQLGDSPQSAWANLEKQKSTLIKIVLLRINAMPKKETTNIKLVSKLTPMEADD